MIIRQGLRWLSPAGDKGRLSILIWHRVLPAPDPMFPGEMHRRRFETVLKRLARWANVLPLPEAVERLKEGTLPERAVAITFDDGYADNFTVAAPLLQRYRMPATFFIATDYLDGGCMWNDRLIESIRRSPLTMLTAGAFGSYDISSWLARRETAEFLLDQIKYLEPAEREEAVRVVARAAYIDYPEDLMMRRDEVRSLQGMGMTLGAHTCSHPILSRLPDDLARKEIASGRSDLEAIINARVGLFAYPNGKPGRDYEAKHVQMIYEMGFDAAVSTAWGASRHGDDVFQLRRFSPWDTGRTRFGLRMMQNLMSGNHQALVASPRTEMTEMSYDA